MAVDEVVCPKCNKPMLVTIPQGQVLVNIDAPSWLRSKEPSDHRAQFVFKNKCPHCGGNVYSYTKLL